MWCKKGTRALECTCKLEFNATILGCVKKGKVFITPAEYVECIEMVEDCIHDIICKSEKEL
jgi:hypothetical protein